MSSEIAIIGAGPRGISVVERLLSYLADGPATAPLTVHLIDDSQHGAGCIWDSSQTRTLCMNTLAGAVTLFTEPGASVHGRVLEGPNLFEWVRLLRGQRQNIAAAKVELFDAHRPGSEGIRDISGEFSEELAGTEIYSNPSRALYGAYLRWVLQVIERLLPPHIRIIHHHHRAVGLYANAADTCDVVELSDGSRLTAAATVLATGWQTPARTAQERRIEDNGIRWIPPGNPLDQPISQIPARETVLVRGLGMGFFDVMALVTENRNGRFISDSTARAGLRYQPSGQEPRLLVTSRRGYPFLPKSEYRSPPPKPRLEFLQRVIEKHSSTPPLSASIDFGHHVWPAIVRDCFVAYFSTLAAENPEALRAPLATIHQAIAEAELPVSTTDAAVTAHAMDDALSPFSTRPWRLADWLEPLPPSPASIPALTADIAARLEHDIAEAVAARRSPEKAALWEIAAARKPVGILGANGRFAPVSRPGCYSQFKALGGMAGSGPPLFRTRQLLALIDAGVVSFLGPHPELDVTKGIVEITSGGRVGRSPCLVDAWMHSPDIRRADDPLTRSLTTAGRVRPFSVAGQTSASPETTADSRQTVRSSGEVDPRLHIIGIPTHAQWADTTISPMPGTDPLFLQETDETAASVLRACGVALS